MNPKLLNNEPTVYTVLYSASSIKLLATDCNFTTVRRQG